MGSVFRCPVCRQELQETATGLTCAAGHHVDRAREGYVNLLPGGRLRGGPSGDDDSMVRARRTVFDAGLYDPIIDAVADATSRALATVDRADERPAVVVDCGCGEGTYLARACAQTGAAGAGIDISRAAVRAAARRHHHLEFAVASSYALPVDDAQCDVVLSVFAPRPLGEVARVLRPGGAAVIVQPGPDHLHQFKALVYDAPRQHREPSEAMGDDGSAWPTPPESITAVRFTVALDDPALRTALLEMTPFWWSATPDRRALVADRARRVDVDMRLTVLRRALDHGR